ncbi:MAG: HAD-IA family hydrolase [bacterium]
MNDRIEAVLFDLDGTLLDTAADIGGALNAILRAHGRAPLPLETIRPHVSKGGMALLCIGFGLVLERAADDPRAVELHRQLLDFYRRNLSAGTRLFPGMEALLARIEDSGRKWGIVTNKPGFLTDPLLRDLGLDARAACVVSGDTLARKKPWPDPLLHACATLGVGVERSVYVGDDARDIESGRRANMRTIAAAYGYIPPRDDPRAWGADAIIHHPDQLRRWLT